MAVARSSSGGIAIHYVLLVFWMILFVICSHSEPNGAVSKKLYNNRLSGFGMQLDKILTYPAVYHLLLHYYKITVHQH